MENFLKFVAALMLLASSAHAQTATWVNSPISTKWTDDANWSSGLQPGVSSNVVIGTTTNGRYPVVSTFGRNCKSLTISAPSGSNVPTLTINAGSDLTVRGFVSNASTLTNNGTLNVVGNLTNNGTVASGGSSLLEFKYFSGPVLPVTISGTGNTTLNDVKFSNNAVTTFTTTNQVKIARVATVQAFNVNADAHVRLTSDAATTTGMIAITGAGQMTGSVSVERAIDPTTNGVLPGNGSTGYRHFSSPVAGVTVGSLATTGFAPVVNPAYSYPDNTTPSPLPNVFYFNEPSVPATVPPRTGTPPAGCAFLPLSAFEYGWGSPADLATPLETTRGYNVQIAATAKAVLSGEPNTGDYATAALTRGANASASGWHLLGNPYPSPIDAYAMMTDNLHDATGNPGGFDATVYFYHSGEPLPADPCNPFRINNGIYQYINTATGEVGAYDAQGQPVANTLQTRYFPTMQGFFVRKVDNTPQPFYFYNYHRLTTAVPSAGTVTPFYRSAAGTTAVVATGKVKLTAVAAVPAAVFQLTDEFTGLRDHAQVSFRANATPGHDARYDAVRPADNVGNPTLFTVNAAAEQCALNALPALAGAVTVPLGLHTLEAGHAYALALTRNTLARGTRVYLTDRHTGRSQELTRQARYAFTAQGTSHDQRFALRFEAPEGATAVPAAERALLVTYPNPGQVGNPLTFKSAGVAGTTAVAVLFDAFGRTVATQQVAVRDGQLTGALATTALKPGLYTLRLTAANAVTTQRLEIR